VGEGREPILALLVAGLGLVAAIRGLPASAEPLGLPCAAASVGRAGDLVKCGGGGALASGERRVLELPIDINAATADELDALPGIGAKLAARIVAERQAHGRFASLDALGQVPGIGAGKLRLLAGKAAVLPGPAAVQPRYTPASR
jgi:competence ComEA-like helix-hairpin-helix protein